MHGGIVLFKRKAAAHYMLYKAEKLNQLNLPMD